MCEMSILGRVAVGTMVDTFWPYTLKQRKVKFGTGELEEYEYEYEYE